MVNKERVQLLYEDLKNNNHLQATEALEKIDSEENHSFCCLGRACRVAIDNGLELEIGTDEQGYKVTFNSSYEVMPWEVVDWYGFSDNNPAVVSVSPDTHVQRTCSLAELNDGIHGRRYSLPEIAEVIRFNFLVD
jgi:hypothetical protein